MHSHLRDARFKRQPVAVGRFERIHIDEAEIRLKGRFLGIHVVDNYKKKSFFNDLFAYEGVKPTGCTKVPFTSAICRDDPSIVVELLSENALILSPAAKKTVNSTFSDV